MQAVMTDSTFGAQTIPYTSLIKRSSRAILAGRIITGVVVAFLVFDAIGKFIEPGAIVQAFARLGVPLSLSPAIGAILLICTAIYTIPRTSVLGAVVLTGYLGGAVMIQLGAGSPLFSETLSPIYFGVLVWLGVYLRNEAVRRLI